MSPKTFQLPGCLLGLLLVCLSTPAHGDSDGYYCVGPDYLAYELWMREPGAKHHLYVVPLVTSVHRASLIRISLPTFDVGSMRCEGHVVQLATGDSLYTVDLSSRIVTTEVPPWKVNKSQPPPTGFVSTNLGGWSPAVRLQRPDTVPLARTDSLHSFALATDIQPQPRICAYKVVTRLLVIDEGHRTTRSVLLFRGLGPMECGE
jgi:hypothetical protein